jgi:hypothetical protein
VITIATEGLPAATGTVLGRLFITYDVELNLPALPTGDAQDGKCCTLWSSTYSTTEPPIGDPLAVAPVITTNNLSYGPAVGNNVMALLPSNGPWARPNLPPADQAALVAWISDSNITSGMQHISFANEGTYILELTVFGEASVNPGAIVAAATLTPDVQIIEYTNSIFSATGPTYYRLTCECVSSDQSVTLTRQNATSTVTWTVLTVCA